MQTAEEVSKDDLIMRKEVTTANKKKVSIQLFLEHKNKNIDDINLSGSAEKVHKVIVETEAQNI